MSWDSPSHQHSWQDFAGVLKLIDLYVKIETKKCETDDLEKLAKLGLKNDKASADYIRSNLYPAALRHIGCIGGRHYIGRESVVYFADDFDDIDEFFGALVSNNYRRNAYLGILEIFSKNQTTSHCRSCRRKPN